MAWKPIKQFESGASCANCWGPGKTFGDISTPKRIYVTGSGFAGACAVCNGTFIAEQDPFSPCLWTFNNGIVLGSWSVGPVFTIFYLAIVGGADCFLQTGGLCSVTKTFGGATVTISPVGPTTPEYRIAFEHNFAPSRSTVYENLGAVNSEKVLRLAKRLDSVNVYVKYKPEY